MILQVCTHTVAPLSHTNSIPRMGHASHTHRNHTVSLLRTPPRAPSVTPGVTLTSSPHPMTHGPHRPLGSHTRESKLMRATFDTALLHTFFASLHPSFTPIGRRNKGKMPASHTKSHLPTRRTNSRHLKPRPKPYPEHGRHP